MDPDHRRKQYDVFGRAESFRLVRSPGLLDTFYDESVSLPEARRLLDQVLAQRLQWRARGALVIIVTKLPPVKTEERAVTATCRSRRSIFTSATFSHWRAWTSKRTPISAFAPSRYAIRRGIPSTPCRRSRR